MEAIFVSDTEYGPCPSPLYNLHIYHEGVIDIRNLILFHYQAKCGYDLDLDAIVAMFVECLPATMPQTTITVKYAHQLRTSSIVILILLKQYFSDVYSVSPSTWYPAHHPIVLTPIKE